MRGELRYDVAKPRRLLREFAAARNLPFLDLAASAALKANLPNAYFSNDPHWTVRGNQIVAGEIAAFLRTLGFLSGELPGSSTLQ